VQTTPKESRPDDPSGYPTGGRVHSATIVVEQTRLVGEVVVNHGTVPADGLYFGRVIHER
jgi:hypothetical protein